MFRHLLYHGRGDDTSKVGMLIRTRQKRKCRFEQTALMLGEIMQCGGVLHYAAYFLQYFLPRLFSFLPHLTLLSPFSFLLISPPQVLHHHIKHPSSSTSSSSSSSLVAPHSSPALALLPFLFLRRSGCLAYNGVLLHLPVTIRCPWHSCAA